LPGTGAEGVTTSTGRGADTEITLIDKADIRQDLPTLAADQMSCAHLFLFFTAAFLADGLSDLEPGRVEESCHKELRCRRATGKVKINAHHPVYRTAVREQPWHVTPVVFRRKKLPDFTLIP
jgi:hypothetical protein